MTLDVQEEVVCATLVPFSNDMEIACDSYLISYE